MQALQSSFLCTSLLNPLRIPSNRQSHQITNARLTRRRSFISASASVSALKRETDPKKRVVITGMDLVSVFGNDVNAYYEKLLSGESGISLIHRLDDYLKYCIVSGKKALESSDFGGDKFSTFDIHTLLDSATLVTILWVIYMVCVKLKANASCILVV
ncbi:hypothetical protein Bca101_045199 [Brassica carinata]